MLADPLDLARRLLEDTRAGRPDTATRAALAGLDPDALTAALTDDASRIAFWLNVYNAAVRARLLAEPAAYSRRWRFFAATAITIAGRRLSPNAIEHGILRRSMFLAGFGYLRNPFASAFERRMRVVEVDPRIHFALNCGARSCPPLAAWEPVALDERLERATGVYLALETGRSADGSEVRVPRLLLWYHGDFGGRAGILRLLWRHGVVPAGEHPRIRFHQYDWTIAIDKPADDV